MCGNKITEKFIRLFRDFEKISVQGGSLYLKSQLVFDRIVLLFNSYWGFELKHKHILKYMSRYYTSDMDKISPVESDSEYDNSIWFFGDDLSKINPLVERCIRQAKKYSGRNVILVSNDNVDKFVDIPEHIWKKYKKGLISKAHYSDYVEHVLWRSMVAYIWILQFYRLINSLTNGLIQNSLRSMWMGYRIRIRVFQEESGLSFSLPVKNIPR